LRTMTFTGSGKRARVVRRKRRSHKARARQTD
jgi:hypothetical protein